MLQPTNNEAVHASGSDSKASLGDPSGCISGSFVGPGYSTVWQGNPGIKIYGSETPISTLGQFFVAYDF